MKGSLLTDEIAEPYAQALMSVAQSNDLTEQFGEDFRSLDALLDNSPELREFLRNPVVNADIKKGVLRQIVGEEGNAYLTNFLMLLVDKRRILVLESIVREYLKLLRDLNQTVLAEVTAASELSDAQKQAAIEKVKAMTDARAVELKTKIDPNLLGGVIVKVGSQILDASLRGQLRRMSLRLNSAT